MKRIFLIFSFFILIFNNHLTAQSTGEGVFLSANDFKNGKISYRHNKTDTKYKFHLNNISFKISPENCDEGYSRKAGQRFYFRIS